MGVDEVSVVGAYWDGTGMGGSGRPISSGTWSSRFGDSLEVGEGRNVKEVSCEGSDIGV